MPVTSLRLPFVGKQSMHVEIGRVLYRYKINIKSQTEFILILSGFLILRSEK